jgi:hypothetical protein
LTVTRGRRFTGAIVLLNVGIDDTNVVRLGGGESYAYDLVPGEHSLGVQWGDSDPFEYDFEIAHGQSLEATVTFGKGVTIS